MHHAAFDWIRGSTRCLLDLLTPLPSWSERVTAHPRRALGYLARDPGARVALRRRLGLGEAATRSPLYDLDRWLA